MSINHYTFIYTFTYIYTYICITSIHLLSSVACSYAVFSLRNYMLTSLLFLHHLTLLYYTILYIYICSPFAGKMIRAAVTDNIHISRLFLSDNNIGTLHFTPLLTSLYFTSHFTSHLFSLYFTSLLTSLDLTSLLYHCISCKHVIPFHLIISGDDGCADLAKALEKETCEIRYEFICYTICCTVNYMIIAD